MESYDDDLKNFEAHGAAPMPVASDQGYIEHGGARIWYATYGSGSPVILLHGGLGHSGNWGYQVPELVSSGHRAVLIDSRGHGRSTRDPRPFTYELMASDVLAVMDALHLESAAVVGWSDGACAGLVLARQAPARIAGVFYFACNMDPSGTKPFELTPTIQRCLARHTRDYAELSATPDQFQAFAEAVQQMQRTSRTILRAIWPKSTCPSPSCKASMMSSSNSNTPNISPEHSRRGIDHPARREPFRTTAKARTIQRRDACFPKQGSFLKEDDAHWKTLRERGISPVSVTENLQIVGVVNQKDSVEKEFDRGAYRSLRMPGLQNPEFC